MVAMSTITRPLKISVVTETWPPEINGVALTLHRLVEELRTLGHPIQVVRLRQPHETQVRRPDTPSADLLLRGIPVPRYPGLQMGLPALRALGKAWRAARPDLVHIATEGPLGWAAARIARKLKIPVTSDFRTRFEQYSAHYGFGLLMQPIERYLKRFHNRTAITLVPTAELRDELDSKGYQRLEVLGRGIDTVRFSPDHRRESLRSRWGVNKDEVVILCVGRLAPEKNLSLLIRGYDRLRSEGLGVRLVLVGHGPMRDELSRERKDIILTGAQTGVDLSEHYASADIFGFASLSETYGNVIPEAMASGLAVVAFDRGAGRELIVDRENGLVADPDTPQAFLSSLGELARDAQLRKRLGDAARRRSLDLGWPAIAAQFEMIVRQTLAASPSNTVINDSRD